jgi:hypothetical protein
MHAEFVWIGKVVTGTHVKTLFWNVLEETWKTHEALQDRQADNLWEIHTRYLQNQIWRSSGQIVTYKPYAVLMNH